MKPRSSLLQRPASGLQTASILAVSSSKPARLTPVGPELTRVDVCFLVCEDTVKGEDYDPQRVTEVWKSTSEQDWELCENNYAGIKSLAYEPGP